MIDIGKKVELLDPKIDYVFKRIFGEKGDEDILMSLINSILKGNPTIKELELLNTEYSKDGVISKGCRFDILAKTSNNIKINIEMQYYIDSNIKNRLIYYSDRLNVEEYKTGDKYDDKNVISIWILANNINDREEPISEILPCFIKKGKDDYEVFNDNKRIILLEIQKYKITDENIKDLLTNWVNFLKTPECLENSEIIKKKENIEVEKALDKLEFMSKSDAEKYHIQSMIDYEKTHLGNLSSALKKGREEGLKEGEKNRSIQIAKNMLEKGLDIKLISELSGLSLDEIEELK